MWQASDPSGSAFAGGRIRPLAYADPLASPVSDIADHDLDAMIGQMIAGMILVYVDATLGGGNRKGASPLQKG